MDYVRTFFTRRIEVDTLGQMVHVEVEATWLNREWYVMVMPW